MTSQQPAWTMQPAGTAPGWYRDAYGANRYWDGQGWTQHVAPVATYQSQPAAPHYMVTKTRKQTSHTFHLIMSILTCGVWAIFVWFPITIYNSMRHDKAKTRLY